MTPTQAIKKARNRVTLVSLGDQWTVHSWSPRHNATWVSHPMSRDGANAQVREGRIAEALRALGVEGADTEANLLAFEEGRWDRLVRHYWKHK